MCGIAGISRHPSSKINTRELTHNLLALIQYRGSDASGFAYAKGDENVGIYKAALPGSALPLTDLPRRATTVIAHTRLATQGAARFNENNHPVLSPTGEIALVHNGVISNDWDFRSDTHYGVSPHQFEGLPAVDTAVIPALIEKLGLKVAASLLEGYAAIAYIDGHTGNDPDVLHLARLDYSPVSFTWLTDGTFVFASTGPLLEAALAQSGLEYGHVWDMPDNTYMKVKGGVILEIQEDIDMAPDTYGTYGRWSNATSGGHGTGDNTTVMGAKPGGIGSSFANGVWDDDDEDGNPNDDLDWDADMALRAGEWSQEHRAKYRDDNAMAFAPEGNGRQVWLPDSETGELTLAYRVDDNDSPLMGFYYQSEDHSMETFDSIDELEKGLGWLSNMAKYDGMPFPDAEPKLKWTNYVIDMGHITTDEGLVSWVKDMGYVDAFESPAIRNLQYVREGISNVITYLG